jgi:hypothetical protein
MKDSVRWKKMPISCYCYLIQLRMGFLRGGSEEKRMKYEKLRNGRRTKRGRGV